MYSDGSSGFNPCSILRSRLLDISGLLAYWRLSGTGRHRSTLPARSQDLVSHPLDDYSTSVSTDRHRRPYVAVVAPVNIGSNMCVFGTPTEACVWTDRHTGGHGRSPAHSSIS